jgi:hypothetical protein
LVFTENRLATNRIRYILLYIPALIFSLVDVTTDLLSGLPVQNKWGYVFNGSNSAFSAITSIWFTTLSFVSVGLSLKYYFKIKERNKKQQTLLITIGVSYPIIANILSIIGYLLFGVEIPYYGSGANAVLCIFIVYAKAI